MEVQAAFDVRGLLEPPCDILTVFNIWITGKPSEAAAAAPRLRVSARCARRVSRPRGSTVSRRAENVYRGRPKTYHAKAEGIVFEQSELASRGVCQPEKLQNGLHDYRQKVSRAGQNSIGQYPIYAIPRFWKAGRFGILFLLARTEAQH